MLMMKTETKAHQINLTSKLLTYADAELIGKQEIMAVNIKDHVFEEKLKERKCWRFSVLLTIMLIHSSRSVVKSKSGNPL